MKLEKLRYLRTELAKEMTETLGANIFYYFKEKWNILDEPRDISAGEIISLEKSKHEPVAYHATGAKNAWFSISGDCVISIMFSLSPQIGTRKNCRERISHVQERAANAFNVAHNPLTALLARDAFGLRISAALKSIEKAVTLDIVGKESEMPKTISLLALDIDYFKQVNDTYGHLYGDQVLRVFGQRLENTADLIRRKFPSRVEFSVGHPSGEEFLVLIDGYYSREELLEWANLFKNGIADDSLPSDEEWKALSDAEDLSMITLPPPQERIVRASIGVVIHSPGKNSTSETDSVKSLLDRADTALYRAKAAGRNQVVQFETILDTCGRILEQDQQTRIVAIDIGTNVGVTLGQEFRVFPAGLTGKKKFIVHDGRTSRTIGLYPRVELTRITVFNAQPELSFAFISNSIDNTIEIESGAELEAIPIGSVGRLVPYTSKFFMPDLKAAQVGDIQALTDFIENEAKKSPGPFAIVFRFSRDREYAKNYGKVASNVALTRLYHEACSDFHTSKLLGFLDNSTLCLVGANSTFPEAQIESFLSKINSEFPELELVAGVFCARDVDDKSNKFNKPLGNKYAIEYAQFAASEYGKSADSKITHFDLKTAERILWEQRSVQAYSLAQADFEKFKQLGVENDRILNIGGLIYMDLGSTKKAIESFQSAIRLNPEFLTYKSNLGISLKSNGDERVSLELFNSFTEKELTELLKFHEYGAFVYATLLAKAKLTGVHGFDKGKFELICGDLTKLQAFEKYDNVGYAEIGIVITDLRQ
jgi:diguanylate cyclase (GGDEF)-like protein